MKKVIALALAILMIFTLVACSDSESSGKSGKKSDASKAIEEYLEQNKDELLDAMEQSFATSSGMTCKSSVKVEGEGFVITIKINELDNVDSETKELMQTLYDSMDSTFDGMLKDMQEELEELEYFEIRICEKDGDVLAVIRAEE